MHSFTYSECLSRGLVRSISIKCYLIISFLHSFPSVRKIVYICNFNIDDVKCECYIWGVSTTYYQKISIMAKSMWGRQGGNKGKGVIGPF